MDNPSLPGASLLVVQDSDVYIPLFHTAHRATRALQGIDQPRGAEHVRRAHHHKHVFAFGKVV